VTGPAADCPRSTARPHPVWQRRREGRLNGIYVGIWVPGARRLGVRLHSTGHGDFERRYRLVVTHTGPHGTDWTHGAGEERLIRAVSTDATALAGRRFESINPIPARGYGFKSRPGRRCR
jgi:hypothetical protein